MLARDAPFTALMWAYHGERVSYAIDRVL